MLRAGRGPERCGRTTGSAQASPPSLPCSPCPTRTPLPHSHTTATPAAMWRLARRSTTTAGRTAQTSPRNVGPHRSRTRSAAGAASTRALPPRPRAWTLHGNGRPVDTAACSAAPGRTASTRPPDGAPDSARDREEHADRRRRNRKPETGSGRADNSRVFPPATAPCPDAGDCGCSRSRRSRKGRRRQTRRASYCCRRPCRPRRSPPPRSTCSSPPIRAAKTSPFRCAGSPPASVAFWMRVRAA